jgi:hypothetical protein
VFNLGAKDVCIINLSDKSIGTPIETNLYPKIAAIDAEHLAAPKVVGDYLYGFLGKHDENGYYICYWLKFNTKPFALEEMKRIAIPGGYTNGAYQFFAGRFL